MSQKRHCDMCDAEISDVDACAGHVKVCTLREQSIAVNMDLCRIHFNAFRRLFNLWSTAQKGGYTSDDERIRALEKVVPQ